MSRLLSSTCLDFRFHCSQCIIHPLFQGLDWGFFPNSIAEQMSFFSICLPQKTFAKGSEFGEAFLEGNVSTQRREGIYFLEFGTEQGTSFLKKTYAVFLSNPQFGSARQSEKRRKFQGKINPFFYRSPVKNTLSRLFQQFGEI